MKKARYMIENPNLYIKRLSGDEARHVGEFIYSFPLASIITTLGTKIGRTRLIKCLKKNGIVTVVQVLDKTGYEIQKTKGVGWKGVDLLQASLQKFGLSLDTNHGPVRPHPGTPPAFGAKWR